MKLWEVIKELEEYPDKKFEDENDSDVKVSCFSGNFSLENGRLFMIGRGGRYKEVKVSVSLQEALTEWANGGNVHSELPGGQISRYCDSDIYPSGKICSILANEILNGTWYIDKKAKEE